MVDYEEALALVNIIDNFDSNILISQTNTTRSLYIERAIDRAEHPEMYPSFDDLSPEKYWVADCEVKVTEDDYLKSASDIFYLAPSIQEIEKMGEELKSFGSAGVWFINSSLALSGIYSLDPIHLITGFTLMAEDNLILAGIIDLPNYNIEIRTGKILWSFADLRAVNILLRCDGVRTINFIFNPTKPKGIPIELWECFKNYIFERHGIELG